MTATDVENLKGGDTILKYTLWSNGYEKRVIDEISIDENGYLETCKFVNRSDIVYRKNLVTDTYRTCIPILQEKPASFENVSKGHRNGNYTGRANIYGIVIEPYLEYINEVLTR